LLAEASLGLGESGRGRVPDVSGDTSRLVFSVGCANLVPELLGVFIAGDALGTLVYAGSFEGVIDAISMLSP
jgi:hypothetical protein